MEQIRSFIAIELSEEVKAGLSSLQAQMKTAAPSCAKWVDPYSVHLTLKFLGNITPAQIEPINQAIETAIKGIPSFNLQIEGLGVFPNMSRVQVVWVGLGGELDKLLLVQKRIESQVSPLGFPTEAKSFVPHLTLARVRDYASAEERQRLGQLVTATQILSGLSFRAASINLMKSQLTPQGALYSRINTVLLTGAE